MTALFARRFSVLAIDDDLSAPDLYYDEHRRLTLTSDGRVFVEARRPASAAALDTETAIKAESSDENVGDAEGSTVTLTEVRGEQHDPDAGDIAGATLATKTTVKAEQPDSPAAFAGTVTLTKVRGEQEDPDPSDGTQLAASATQTRAGAEDPDISDVEPPGFETETSIDNEEPDLTIAVLLQARTQTFVRNEGEDVPHELGGPATPPS